MLAWGGIFLLSVEFLEQRPPPPSIMTKLYLIQHYRIDNSTSPAASTCTMWGMLFVVVANLYKVYGKMNI